MMARGHLIYILIRRKVLALSRNNTSEHHGKRLSFRYKYVGANANIQTTRYSGDWLTVEATSVVSERGHYLVRGQRGKPLKLMNAFVKRTSNQE